ncbi:MAG: hypothetical protein ABWZ52_12090 [Acidimicrobiales bacterium]
MSGVPWLHASSGVVVAPAVVEGAGEAAVGLGGGAAFGGFLDVVDLRIDRRLITAGVEARAVAQLDGVLEGASEEAPLGTDVDHP